MALVVGLLLKLKVAAAISITRIAAVVTLDAHTGIFSDKAGTLHKMTVQSFWLSGSFETLRGAVIAGAETQEGARCLARP